MEKELGADVIKATQTSLGKYVKRPPLTEKLLRKPPFRFLHDIVSAVHKTTGFFEGLFEEDELISENVKNRESKITFLNKVISVIGTTTGKSLAVKSSKIVAGQEPDKTNELLQCLALALDKKLSSDEAVKKYKDSIKTMPSQIKQNDIDTSMTLKKNDITKKIKSKSNEKMITNKKEPHTVNEITSSESKLKRLEKHVPKNEVQLKKPHQLKNNKSTAATVTNKTNPPADLKESQHVSEKEGAQKGYNITNVDQSNGISNAKNTKGTDDELNISTSKSPLSQSNNKELQGELHSSTIVENELNSSLSSQDLMEVENSKLSENFAEVNTTDDIVQDKEYHSQNTISAVESSILPIESNETLTRNDSIDADDKNNEVDRRKTNTDKSDSASMNRKKTDVRPLSVRPSSSRPGAPRLREKIDNIIPDNVGLLMAKVNIITENTNNEDEEESMVVVSEVNDEAIIDTQPDQLQLLSIEHGHLVQQILDSQKEFAQAGKTEIEWQFGAQKVKEAVNQEIEQLRFNIQALSRVANPLGKLLDHIQEDAEVMRQELQQWNNVYDEVSKEMHKQKTANDETLVPLQTRIKHLDIGVQEKRDKIDDLKILIHKNASRIEKLLTNGNVQ